MKNIKIERNGIIINGINIHLENEIEEYLIYENSILVIRLVYKKGDAFRNVLAFNTFGEQIWRIPLNENTKFPFIKIEKDGNDLIAYNFSGLRLRINPENGTIIDKEAVK